MRDKGWYNSTKCPLINMELLKHVYCHHILNAPRIFELMSFDTLNIQRSFSGPANVRKCSGNSLIGAFWYAPHWINRNMPISCCVHLIASFTLRMRESLIGIFHNCVCLWHMHYPTESARSFFRPCDSCFVGLNVTSCVTHDIMARGR